MKLNPKTELTVKTALFSAVFTLVLFSLANFFVNRSWNFFSTNNSKTHPVATPQAPRLDIDRAAGQTDPAQHQKQ